MGKSFGIANFFYPLQIFRMRKILKNTEYMSLEDLHKFQFEKLKMILNYSYQHVPYYKECFDKLGLKPQDIKKLEDISLLPVLTKDILKERFSDLRSDIYLQHRPFLNRTSGSTGTPLKFYQDKNINIAKFAFFWREWNWGGYKIGRKMVVFEGMADENLLFKYDISLNALRLSSYKLSAINSKLYLEKILNFKPLIIRSFPSVLYEFARFIEDEISPGQFSFLKGIISGAETLQDYQRNYIEKVFGCKVFDCYHSWESVCMISECEKHHKHHHMEYGLLELTDKNDNLVKDGELGEITATGFYNLAMPLIRYKTRDLAVRKEGRCSCGRNHDLIESIDGRVEDVIISPEGYHIAGSSFNFIKFNQGFDYGQVVQNDKDSLDIMLVKNKFFKESELNILENYLRKQVGSKFLINYHFVDKIERTKNGKIRFVINKSGLQK